jgi:hypothetical protein
VFSLIKRKMLADGAGRPIVNPHGCAYGGAVLDSHTFPSSRDLPSVRRLLMTLAAGCVIPIVLLALAVQRSEEINSIILLDATGRELMNTASSAGADPSAQSRSEMLEPLRRGRPVTLDLFRSPAGTWVAGMGLPIRVRDQWAYSLVAQFDPALLQQPLLRQQLPASWNAAVLDSGGKIVARSHDAARYLGTLREPSCCSGSRRWPKTRWRVSRWMACRSSRPSAAHLLPSGRW